MYTAKESRRTQNAGEENQNSGGGDYALDNFRDLVGPVVGRSDWRHRRRLDSHFVGDCGNSFSV
jgi:hypothetical protein